MLDTEPIVLERSLVTAAISYPFEAGWLDAAGVNLVARLSTAEVKDAVVALVDSVDARALLATHAIVRGGALSSRRHSMLTFATHTRPDDVSDVSVVLDDVSAAGTAVAAIVIPDFYGITVRDWTIGSAAVSATTALVTEGAAALIPIEDDESYQEDLGRAWFLMTDTPFVSHVCMARRDLLATAPGTLAAHFGRIVAARDIARSRGRELRRNLSQDHGVEREVLTDALADQTDTLGTEEERGLLELWKRSGRPLGANDRRSAFVSLG